MKFIDLFSGLGGFHKALHELGHKCVFACELNLTLREIYKQNWGIEPKGDIRKIVSKEIDSIPPHDILCAGFPCQPFSKAGKQLGMDDEEHGTLFDEIVKILKYHKPKFFLLENVPFIANHDNEATWVYMKRKLRKLGYDVDHKNYSPHEFGIPQHRYRIFIVGSLIGLEHFDFSKIDEGKINILNISNFIEEYSISAKRLPRKNIECLNLWQEFFDCIPSEVKLPGHPIWGMEFGATYPFEEIFPFKMSAEDLSRYRGNFGISLRGLKRKEQFALLPSYARTDKKFPAWKKRFIRENRNFYQENKKFIQNIVDRIAKLEFQSWQKLEWNVGDDERIIQKYILQFRASGIRIKKLNFFPSLVCTNTQIPIIGWQQRYISKEEGIRLQSLEGIQLPENNTTAFKALGNAVNAKIVKMIAENLLAEQPKEKENGHTQKIHSEKQDIALVTY